jgi:hypothetical protein
MWLITQDGFFSVTAYDPRRGGARRDSDDLLIVRARARDDLERIGAWIGIDILETPRADYPFRVVTSRQAWVNYLSHATTGIDYFNFKDRVSERLGSDRHDVLMSVWSSLRRLQNSH